MNAKPTLNRREFLKLSALSGGGLLLSIALGDEALAAVQPNVQSTPIFQPNVFVAIDTNGIATLTVPRPDMGQGTRTALPMILAEELDVDWAKVRVVQAPGGYAYGNQSATGSSTIPGTYSPLRLAGATARAMLVAAAAQLWKVAVETCRTENGSVLHDASGQKLSYAELAQAASLLSPGDFRKPTLKDPADFRIIGTDIARYDEPDIVQGKAIYGMDVRLPGMLYAVLARPPVYGAKVVSYEDADARAVNGVRDVIPVLIGRADRGIAVLAEHTWAALKGRDALKIVWDEGTVPDLNSEGIRAQLSEKLEAALVDLEEPDANASTVEALYETPYLAHATMEPMNCTASVSEETCEVWAPTQSPLEVQTAAQQISKSRNVIAHVTLSGGGFGRRSLTDYVQEAVFLSKAVGAPVQVMWTRADDIRYDYFHPKSMIHMRAQLNGEGLPESWRHLVVGQPITSAGFDPLSQATTGLGYDLGTARTVTRTLSDAGVPTGIWRSVYNINNTFAVESFLDEIAAAGGRDPYELRRTLLTSDRRREVLNRVAEMAAWGSPLPEGWGRGIAFHNTWGVTDVGLVLEVSVTGSEIHVQRAFCAVNCGIAINPDMVKAQMEGGIVMGLTAALKREITFENGLARQSNFDDYPLLYMDEMPEIVVEIIPSTDAPGGVGEMSVSLVGPALANAIYHATGKRLRRMPFQREDLV